MASEVYRSRAPLETEGAGKAGRRLAPAAPVRKKVHGVVTTGTPRHPAFLLGFHLAPRVGGEIAIYARQKFRVRALSASSISHCVCGSSPVAPLSQGASLVSPREERAEGFPAISVAQSPHSNEIARSKPRLGASRLPSAPDWIWTLSRWISHWARGRELGMQHAFHRRFSLSVRRRHKPRPA